MPSARSGASAHEGDQVSRLVAAWSVVGVYALGIFLLSAQSSPFGMTRIPVMVDKLLHAALFGGWSLALFVALRRTWPRASVAALCGAAIGLTVLYGASDEYHQSFVPHREMDPYDVLADGVGAVLAQVGVRLKARGA